jgi:hypothetical protein
MIESKFTPGPWIAKRMPCQTGKHLYNSDVIAVNGFEVASILKESDAQLIAAAPDLLAACEAFVEADCQDGASLAFSMAVDAIAKAKVVV